MNTLSSLLKFIAYFEPLGSIKMFAGSSAPDKWLICDGSAVSRTTYANLFDVIGTTYGAGDGSTTFNLPDFRGRVPIGAGTGTATDATAHALGSVGGAETHTLTISEMPTHGHIATDASIRYYTGVPDNSKGSTSWGWGTTNLSNLLQDAGGDGAHNNMQPYTTVNYIIYAGV